MVSTLIVGNGFTIDPEFAELCPPLTPEEKNRLMASIERDGCRDALVIWEEERLLIDGHTRYEICSGLDLEYRTTTVSLPDRAAAIEWIVANQLGRRNATPDQKAELKKTADEYCSYLRGKRYEQQKKQGERHDLTCGHDDHKSTAKKIGDELGVSAKTIQRDSRFAQAVDEIGESVSKEAKREILSGKSPLSKEKITALAGKPAEEQVAALQSAKNPAIKAPDMPTIADDKLTKSEQEAKEVRDEFFANLEKVSDGGVYTIRSLADALGIIHTSVHWFVRMCEVSPAVIVHRNFGRKGLVQYSFVKTNCADGSARIRQLAEQIATDDATSSKSCAAAQRILSLLGG